MNLLIKLFGEKNKDNCCAIEIKEITPVREACCQDAEKSAEEQTEPEAKQPECC